MLLVIDNYDSFTYNLVQYVGEFGAVPEVRRNDTLTVDEALALAPAGILVSPGPGTPAQAGIAIPLIRAAAGRRIPVFGVCLGHQAIGEAFGGAVVRAGRLMHGKTCPVVHDGTGPLAGLPSPLTVMRYHSLVIDPGTLPTALRATAWAADVAEGRAIMAVEHRELPIWGVQFHPESIGTDQGRAMIGNFLRISGLAAVK